MSRQRLLLWLTLVRRLAVGWVLSYVAVCLLGGHPHAKYLLLVLFAGWLAVLILCRRVKTVKHPSPSKLLRCLEVLATNFAFTLLLGELGLRALAALTGPSLLASDTLLAHKLIPGHDYGHGLVGNSLGYPGRDHSQQKPPGVRRVAALGDSFAIGPAVAFADNYLTLLEEHTPDTDVLNFGVSGAGPRDYLAVLQHDVWPFQPDLVLVSVFIGNDITETLATPRPLTLQSHALYLLCQRGWRQLVEKQRQGTPTLAADRLSQPPLSPQTYLEVEARRLAVCQVPPPPALEKQWQRALRHLEQLIEACRSHQTPVRFVLIPDEFQVNSQVLNQALVHAGLDRDGLDLDEPQRRLRAFCQKQNVPCLDLLPACRGRSDLYSPCDTHWNKNGNHLAAEQIRHWLMTTWAVSPS
jgi:hypothetical protein